MDRAALLSDFQGHVEEFEKYQGFIDKTKSQAAKFAAHIVEKVIKDNSEKCAHLAETIIPLTADMEGVIEAMTAERQEALAGRDGIQFELEVLQLRLVIGELDQAGHDAESAALNHTIADIDANVAAIDVVFDQYKAAMGRWKAVRERSGTLVAPKPAGGKKGQSLAGVN